MKDYIKWFFEEFLKEDFNSKELLSIWMTKHKIGYENTISNITINFKQPEQMTIFDEDIFKLSS